MGPSHLADVVGSPLFTAGPLIPLLVFWSSGAILVYTFAGYSVLMRSMARSRPESSPGNAAYIPEICVVLVAHNEEQRIAARLENLLASEYPQEKLHILVVSDGSTDATGEMARAFSGSRVRVVLQNPRAGKAAGLNAGLSQCDSEVVVFADARQSFAAGAIRRLASLFADPKVGAVSGELDIAAAGSSTGAGVDAYWRHERRLRAAEARYDSCIGCTGAIYAIRRELFTPLPGDTLLDDVVIPMRIAVGGHRVVHDPEAHAFDPQALEPAAEKRRKCRTLAGNFQMLLRYPAWGVPWKNRLWWQLISHKYLRLFAPLFLFTTLASNLILADRPFYAATLAAQALFYVLAILGSLPGSRRRRILALPAGFVFLMEMVLRGFAQYLRGRNGAGWK